MSSKYRLAAEHESRIASHWFLHDGLTDPGIGRCGFIARRLGFVMVMRFLIAVIRAVPPSETVSRTIRVAIAGIKPSAIRRPIVTPVIAVKRNPEIKIVRNGNRGNGAVIVIAVVTRVI